MASRQPGASLNHLGPLFTHGTACGLSERELLDRFLAARDEIAFEAILARHGAMVLGVCRRILSDRHEIEDAFQATFLVFARRAGTIRGAESVGRWLHGVARRVALRARANAAIRTARQTDDPDADAEPASPGGSPEGVAAGKELLAVLDDELTRLPATLRSPMVLCYLEGLTHDEAATRLGWPVGTVHSRLSRARDQLRRRLTRRGLKAEDAILSAALAYPPVPPSLIRTTVRLSLEFTSRRAVAAAAAPAVAPLLAQGVLDAMMISNLKMLGATTLACALTLGGLRTYAVSSGAKAGGPEQGSATRPDQKHEPLKANPDPEDELIWLRRSNRRLAQEVDTLRRELESLQRPPRPDPPVILGRGGRDDDQSSLPPSTGGRAGRLDPQPAPAPATGGQLGGRGMGRGRDDDDMSGFGRGMGRGREDDNAALMHRPMYNSTGQIIVVASPDGNTVTAYSTETGKAKSLQLLRHGNTKLEVFPVTSPSIAALQLKGPAIAQVAAFSLSDGNWHTQNLREMADNATPNVGPSLISYAIGRRVYAFSGVANRWDVLELQEGAVAQPIVGLAAITCQNAGRLHVFSAKIGTWETISIQAPETTLKP